MVDLLWKHKDIGNFTIWRLDHEEKLSFIIALLIVKETLSLENLSLNMVDDTGNKKGIFYLRSVINTLTVESKSSISSKNGNLQEASRGSRRQWRTAKTRKTLSTYWIGNIYLNIFTNLFPSIFPFSCWNLISDW